MLFTTLKLHKNRDVKVLEIYIYIYIYIITDSFSSLIFPLILVNIYVKSFQEIGKKE